MKYRAVLFDLDGTLLATLDDIRDSLNHTLSLYGFPEQSEAQVRAHVGNGSGRLVELSLPRGTDEPAYADVLRDYNAWYTAHCRVRTRPYPGVTDLMERLGRAGVRCAVVSNKPDSAVKPLCAEFFGALSAAAVGERPGVRRKPAPDTLLAALDELGIPPSEAVYVGDSEVDVETARRAGLPCVSVLWGYRTREELLAAGAGCLAGDAEALWRALQ